MGPGCQSDPLVSETKTGEAASTALNTVKLADGDFSSDEEGTSVTVTTSRID